MSRHWMILLQRENRARTFPYARPVLSVVNGKKILGPEFKTSGPTRAEERARRRADRSLVKAEATRTAKQRANASRAETIALSVLRLESVGINPVLHPNNLHVPLSLRRKLKRPSRAVQEAVSAPGSSIWVPGKHSPVSSVPASRRAPRDATKRSSR